MLIPCLYLYKENVEIILFNCVWKSYATSYHSQQQFIWGYWGQFTGWLWKLEWSMKLDITKWLLIEECRQNVRSVVNPLNVLIKKWILLDYDIYSTPLNIWNGQDWWLLLKKNVSMQRINIFCILKEF